MNCTSRLLKPSESACPPRIFARTVGKQITEILCGFGDPCDSTYPLINFKDEEHQNATDSVVRKDQAAIPMAHEQPLVGNNFPDAAVKSAAILQGNRFVKKPSQGHHPVKRVRIPPWVEAVADFVIHPLTQIGKAFLQGGGWTPEDRLALAWDAPFCGEARRRKLAQRDALHMPQAGSIEQHPERAAKKERCTGSHAVDLPQSFGGWGALAARIADRCGAQNAAQGRVCSLISRDCQRLYGNRPCGSGRGFPSCPCRSSAPRRWCVAHAGNPTSRVARNPEFRARRLSALCIVVCMTNTNTRGAGFPAAA